MSFQTAFPLPDDEPERLEAVHALSILDSAPEPSFDRITRLAKLLFGMHASAISLIDSDRQWFKSNLGFSCSEMPRDQAFCTHTILSNDPLILPDTLKNPLFANHPLVIHSPCIRFYAGIPLNTRNGSKIGALCVVDTKPRPDWNRLRTAILTELAEMVCQELENRSLKAREAYLLSLNTQLQTELTSKLAF